MYDSVLIIEDEVDLLDFLEQALKSRFNLIYCAKNATEAIEVLKKHPVSMIISDVNLPDGVSGIEIVKNARALGYTCPVIFQTGNGEKDVALAALRLGAADLLEKPYSVSDLIASVERCISIEKRKENLTLLQNQDSGNEQIEKEKKMIGLMQVVNTKKKIS